MIYGKFARKEYFLYTNFQGQRVADLQTKFFDTVRYIGFYFQF